LPLSGNGQPGLTSGKSGLENIVGPPGAGIFPQELQDVRWSRGVFEVVEC
jgi:hypothetical protein